MVHMVIIALNIINIIYNNQGRKILQCNIWHQYMCLNKPFMTLVVHHISLTSAQDTYC